MAQFQRLLMPMERTGDINRLLTEPLYVVSETFSIIPQESWLLTPQRLVPSSKINYRYWNSVFFRSLYPKAGEQNSFKRYCASYSVTYTKCWGIYIVLRIKCCYRFKQIRQAAFFFLLLLLHSAFKAICAMVLALTAFAEQVSMHDMFLHVE